MNIHAPPPPPPHQRSSYGTDVQQLHLTYILDVFVAVILHVSSLKLFFYEKRFIARFRNLIYFFRDY